jgi:hypothetical protein
VSDLEKITTLCKRLGAEPDQAAIMASQLLKRADQIAAQRGIAREQALAQLLQILVEGRQGNVPPNFPSSSSLPSEEQL